MKKQVNVISFNKTQESDESVLKVGRSHACMHACIHTYMYAYTYIHTYIHSYIHAYMIHVHNHV